MLSAVRPRPKERFSDADALKPGSRRLELAALDPDGRKNLSYARALLASIFPGALFAFFLAWLLPANLIPFLPLMAVGYRLIWLAVSWMISLVSLRRHAVFEDTRENLANENQNAK